MKTSELTAIAATRIELLKAIEACASQWNILSDAKEASEAANQFAAAWAQLVSPTESWEVR